MSLPDALFEELIQQKALVRVSDSSLCIVDEQQCVCALAPHFNEPHASAEEYCENVFEKWVQVYGWAIRAASIRTLSMPPAYVARHDFLIPFLPFLKEGVVLERTFRPDMPVACVQTPDVITSSQDNMTFLKRMHERFFLKYRLLGLSHWGYTIDFSTVQYTAPFQRPRPPPPKSAGASAPASYALILQQSLFRPSQSAGAPTRFRRLAKPITPDRAQPSLAGAPYRILASARENAGANPTIQNVFNALLLELKAGGHIACKPIAVGPAVSLPSFKILNEGVCRPVFHAFLSGYEARGLDMDPRTAQAFWRHVLPFMIFNTPPGGPDRTPAFFEAVGAGDVVRRYCSDYAGRPFTLIVPLARFFRNGVVFFLNVRALFDFEAHGMSVQNLDVNVRPDSDASCGL